MINMSSEKAMRWSYKTEHFSLKKEGLLGSAFLDEAEIELSLNEFGKAGWELVSFMEVNDGIIAIFKQPFNKDLTKVLDQEDVTRPGLRVFETAQQTVEEKPALPKAESVIENEFEEDVGDIKIF